MTLNFSDLDDKALKQWIKDLQDEEERRKEQKKKKENENWERLTKETKVALVKYIRALDERNKCGYTPEFMDKLADTTLKQLSDASYKPFYWYWY